MIVPIDKLTKTVMHLDADEYAEMLTSRKPAAIDEKLRGQGNVLTRFWLELVGGYADLTPMDEFDFDVLTACISAQAAGHKGITFSEIARLMAGNKPHNAYFSPELKARIMKAVERMMCTKITVDFTELVDKGKYPKLPKKLTSTILPCEILDGVTVNGQRDCTIVYFHCESPLFKVACAKNRQLVTYPVAFLDVAKQRNTEIVTMVKHYVTKHVFEVIGQKNHKLASTIRFDCIAKNCGLVGAPRWQRQDAVKTIRAVFEKLKAEGKISAFELVTEFGEISAVKFKFKCCSCNKK